MNESNQFNLSEQELAQISRFCLNPLSSETRVLLLVSLADCKEKCKALLASQGLVQLLQVNSSDRIAFGNFRLAALHGNPDQTYRLQTFPTPSLPPRNVG